MKATELRLKENAQLKEDLVQLRKEQLSLRFQRANGKLKNTARFKIIRRDIARLKTVMTETLQTTN
ncbi:MAG: 50S ribosomal protein L29 [Alphaproteobacteria bacterium]|jgi:large subunit ribosomal protein L29|nr:50S ribosomal protein L29 [Alphaproteobacteria bacterium]MDP1975038.1 50S ribosomal protein L29 [Alphaproteobacteria bacterium]MDP3532792.1 50S ribosomal protein L29 [Alphaproteobacteria bacterium]